MLGGLGAGPNAYGPLGMLYSLARQEDLGAVICIDRFVANRSNFFMYVLPPIRYYE